jgi:flagellar protein FliO/FliZ
VDTVWLALRVIVSLGAVLGALWFGHRWFTKGRFGSLRIPVKAITVAARHGLGAKAGVAIVEADGRRYLLGVTEHAVTVLDRLDGQAPPLAQQQTTTVAVLATGPVPAVGGQEARVVSVVTTGPVPTERLADQAGGSTTFEQELALAASLTAAIAVPAAQPVQPAQPQPEVLRIQPSGDGQPLTRRAAREAQAAQARPAKPASPLAGSILSPETWRQTAAALKRAR